MPDSLRLRFNPDGPGSLFVQPDLPRKAAERLLSLLGPDGHRDGERLEASLDLLQAYPASMDAILLRGLSLREAGSYAEAHTVLMAGFRAVQSLIRRLDFRGQVPPTYTQNVWFYFLCSELNSALRQRAENGEITAGEAALLVLEVCDFCMLLTHDDEANFRAFACHAYFALGQPEKALDLLRAQVQPDDILNLTLALLLVSYPPEEIAGFLHGAVLAAPLHCASLLLSDEVCREQYGTPVSSSMRGALHYQSEFGPWWRQGAPELALSTVRPLVNKALQAFHDRTDEVPEGWLSALAR
jgi:hypothetical protein